jgi:hypothetical protein
VHRLGYEKFCFLGRRVVGLLRLLFLFFLFLGDRKLEKEDRRVIQRLLSLRISEISSRIDVSDLLFVV